ncbi:MAG: hypothetical protein LBP30_03685 [Clostridiales Family XIII bacterium]|jgi:hypothetical protein|nr:hypothetical protein [Clostridiales Family XIII bacterium]
MERVKNVLNFKKRSRIAIVAVVGLAAVLAVGFACGKGSNDLVEFGNPPDSYARIFWGERIYEPYANAAENDFYNRHRGKQMGHMSDRDLKVFELKGYAASEWLAWFAYGEVTLYKNVVVKEIPGELLVLRLAGRLSMSEPLKVIRVISGRTEETTFATYADMYAAIEWIRGLKLVREAFETGRTPGNDSEGGETYVFDNGHDSMRYVKNGPDSVYVNYNADWYKVENPSDPPMGNSRRMEFTSGFLFSQNIYE